MGDELFYFRETVGIGVAFRIESLTRVVDRPILVSAAFAEGWAEGGPFTSCGSHEVKGFEEAVEVFAVDRSEG